MGRKKKKSQWQVINSEEFKEKQKEYLETLKTNPQYSLLVDPENKYNLSDDEKNFIGIYCEFKSLELATLMSNLQNPLNFFSSYPCQQEIRRINVAMYHAQFANKLLSIEEIGGYLSSLLTDNVPAGDRIGTVDKLKVAEKLIEINCLLHDGINNPKNIIDANVQEELKELSVDSIKLLLAQSKKSSDDEKDKLIREFKNFEIFTDEELSYLKSLSVSEILSLLNEIEVKKKEVNK